MKSNSWTILKTWNLDSLDNNCNQYDKINKIIKDNNKYLHKFSNLNRQI